MVVDQFKKFKKKELTIFPLLDGKIPLSQVKVCSDDTIYQVKKKIERTSNIEIEKQDIYIGSETLEDYRTVAYYNIKKNEKIRIVRKFQVLIKSTQKQTAVPINPSDTILQLKEKYYEMEMIPVKDQKLTFKGKELNNDKTL